MCVCLLVLVFDMVPCSGEPLKKIPVFLNLVCGGDGQTNEEHTAFLA